MLTQLFITLTVMSAPPADVLRDAAQEDAKAKAKQEKSLEVIDKLLKAPAPPSSKPKACPVCTLPEAALLDVRIERLTLDGSYLFGIAETWRVDPPPPEKLAETPFTVPLPEPVAEEPTVKKPPGVPGWVWGLGGLTIGAIVVALVMQ